jgi:phytoene dehydrogenase-like protein
MADYDVVIAGGGHNGLACGAVLAKEGLSVLVAERGKWLGGGVVTREVTLPGFKHDMYGSSHVWIHANAEFVKLLPELEELGLRYVWANDHITGHPFNEGPGIIVYKDVDKTVASIAQYSEKDARRYKEIYDGFVDIKDGFITNFFSPPAPPSYLPAVMENSEEGLEMLRNYALSPLDFTLESFENEYVRSFILGWATAPGINPIQEGKGDMFYIMIPAIHVYGESIPEGGTMQLPLAFAKLIERYGGRVLTESPVKRFIVEDGEAKGIELEDGQKIMANKAVVTNLNPKLTFLEMMDDGLLDGEFLRKVRNYNPGDFTIVRVHYALNEPPRYKCSEEMNRTPFQRIFGSVEDIKRQYAEMSMGIAPTNPFLWVACWTLVDPTRAPDGNHTLIMDTFVPIELASGESWDDVGEDYIVNVELEKLREYTTNMTNDNILAAYVDTGPSIERDNPCFVNGTTTGGAMRMSQSGYLRPFPGYSQYRGPFKKFYMTGPYTHPGGAISAAGTITANVILEDLGIREPEF